MRDNGDEEITGERNFLWEVLETEWQKQSGVNYACLLSSPIEGLAQLKCAILAAADGCSSLCCSNSSCSMLACFLSCFGGWSN